MRNILRILAVSAVFITVGSPAFAADGLDVTPVVTQVVDFVFIGLGVAAGVLVKFAVGWLSAKAKVEDQAFKALATERVNQILYHAIEYTEAYIKSEIAKPDSPLRNVQINNFFVKTAAQYAISVMSGKGGLKEVFGLTEDDIKDRILTRLNDRLNFTDSQPVQPSTSTAVEVIKKE